MSMSEAMKSAAFARVVLGGRRCESRLLVTFWWTGPAPATCVCLRMPAHVLFSAKNEKVTHGGHPWVPR